MSVNCGIVGLPNVGKSTIFSALTRSDAPAENYPFCTIDPNVGLVKLPDDRLEKLAKIIRPQKVISTTFEFVDIAGLVKGASQGEGLGNQFLGHIRQVGVMAHILRAFDDPDITHVHGQVDPLADMEVIHTELAMADLETVEKRISQSEKLLKSAGKNDKGKMMQKQFPVLQRLQAHLQKGLLVVDLDLDDEDQLLIQDLHLLTSKKQIYVCNVDEESLKNGGMNPYVEKVKKYCEEKGLPLLTLCGQIEKEISAMESEEDRREFLDELGIQKSGLDSLVELAYHTLNLRTYYTAGEKEVRAWTFKKGMLAPQTASLIHTDFERGFIKAEVYASEKLFELGSVAKVKENGALRIEGKEYEVRDGDVMHFRFNV